MLTVRADGEQLAVQRVEELGCAVLAIREINTGEYEVTVAMPVAARSAVAYAVVRKDVSFARAS